MAKKEKTVVAEANKSDDLNSVRAELKSALRKQQELETVALKLTASNEKLTQQVSDLLKELAEKPEVVVHDHDCVYLDGEYYKVVMRNSAKEMMENIKKRHVAESVTVVALNREGS